MLRPTRRCLSMDYVYIDIAVIRSLAEISRSFQQQPKPNNQFPWNSPKRTAPVKKKDQCAQKKPMNKAGARNKNGPSSGKVRRRCSLYIHYNECFLYTHNSLSRGWELMPHNVWNDMECGFLSDLYLFCCIYLATKFETNLENGC